MQVAFYQSDYTRMAQDVLDGVIDVCFIQSGILEQTVPSKLRLFSFLHLVNASYEGEPYPFLISTPMVPTYGLAAGPHVPWALRQQVATALMHLNRTNPAMQTVKLSAFTVPASYESVRQTGLALGILSRRGEGASATYDCLDQFIPTDNLQVCPAGFVWGSRDAVAAGCAAAGTPCPPGLECLCRPCSPDLPVTLQWLPQNRSDPAAAPPPHRLVNRLLPRGRACPVVTSWCDECQLTVRYAMIGAGPLDLMQWIIGWQATGLRVLHLRLCDDPPKLKILGSESVNPSVALKNRRAWRPDHWQAESG
jgi:hypothetical protein